MHLNSQEQKHVIDLLYDFQFESKPSSLNRVVPQVLCHKLVEYLFIFIQNMLLGLG